MTERSDAPLERFAAWWYDYCIKQGIGSTEPRKALALAAWDAALRSDIAPLTDTYVQTVPDKCDRITWRGDYYHLDALKNATPQELRTTTASPVSDSPTPAESASPFVATGEFGPIGETTPAIIQEWTTPAQRCVGATPRIKGPMIRCVSCGESWHQNGPARHLQNCLTQYVAHTGPEDTPANLKAWGEAMLKLETPAIGARLIEYAGAWERSLAASARATTTIDLILAQAEQAVVSSTVAQQRWNELAELAEAFPELNPNNFDEEDVRRLNDWGIKVYYAFSTPLSATATRKE